MSDTLVINGKTVAINGEKNLLELIRKQGIELPTFCYHSELSVYGACRMCLVEEENMGIIATCSTAPQPGMNIKTHSPRVQRIRKMALELLLANHDRDCTTCSRNGNCKLQDLAQRFGIDEVRFGTREEVLPVDNSSPSIVRNPNKCILCGDCVRTCQEIQGIGVLDFANRGSKSIVAPAFNKDLIEVDCVACGQCVAVCPTGALTIKSDISRVWEAINDPAKTVVVQIAPAVRVAIGEEFGMEPGEIQMGQLVAALKRLGFDKVFDTSFAADLTVMEETAEFIERFKEGKKLPQFTSCCPAWVKYAEEYAQDFLDNLSSCKSPQQMFGSVAKRFYSQDLGIDPEDMVVVSIMPCTAKKFEAQRPEFITDGVPDVDVVITTQEVASMIKKSGLVFSELGIESLDMPLGFSTGAGVIFGVTGGVSEAVLRNAYEKITGDNLDDVEFKEVRGFDGIKEAEVELDGKTVRLAVVHGLSNVGDLIKAIKKGEKEYDLIEVMACPGGCIGGGGQPTPNNTEVREKRAQGMYNCDKLSALHKSQENPMVNDFYRRWFGEENSDVTHKHLHTSYEEKQRINTKGIELNTSESSEEVVPVQVCVGTCCYLHGSYDLLQGLIERVEEEGLSDKVDIEATFCFENCKNAPSVKVGNQLLSKVESVDDILKHLKPALK
ncbi:NADH-dependent [FeFe] hydrogenase, group A6 [Halothermothrix orenii]|uniref:NADH dehydrogenase I subunit G n=1 Tax=Halothermothrix orenii (strain H 168 / OCM 544 / DSM 9562) TaxID=373903 RepID=B8D0X4_HALOH|nr:NADH-dependent [FeFe] hydrogenase, group A6 [Halothermothrix orenii]ACL68943.1 NADH dehydrogenase I subunit G [Halothermothrix orenii H 168]